MMVCTAGGVTAALGAAARTVAEHRDELVELDRVIGDADHGENMDRGFRAAVAKVDQAGPEKPGAVLKLIATTLISTVGGASGPLYGTAFLRASSTVGDVEELDGLAVASALQAALEGVVARGKAATGDKTMVDALTPAAEVAKERAAEGKGPADVLVAAARAAHEGAQNTQPLIARKGRASYLGERSVGHVDPGARSTALLLEAFAVAAGESA